MTGQDLINYIEEGKLQDKHFFINVEGYISAIGSVLKTENENIILSQEGMGITDIFDDVHNRERYFEEWFNIIPKHDAKILWDDGDRSFLVLRKDGSDAYADCYDSWEEIPEDALFGLDKEEFKEGLE